MSIFDIWTEGNRSLAEETEWNLKQLKDTTKGLTIDDLRKSVEKLHSETRRIKKEGVTVWNAKEKMPKIFDIVDGSFVTMKELVEKLAELETRLVAVEKKEPESTKSA